VRVRLDPALLAILVMALAIRLYQFDAPYVDTHSWRQVTNADIARLWIEDPINVFFPPVSWGGPHGYVGLEFPLLQALTALVWRVTGHSEPLGRLVPIAFSVGSVWVMALLGEQLFRRPVGLAAAFLLAFSPTFVFFGRTLFSDVPMMFFSLVGVYGYASYYYGERRRGWAVVGAIGVALAGLTKVPSILILGPIVWMAWLRDGWRAARDPWLVTGVLGAAGAISLWYLHADRIYLETGLTQAIFRPSGSYTGALAAVAGPFSKVSHWTDWRAANLAEIGRVLWERLWDLHLTPVGVLGAAIGFFGFWTTRTRTVVDVWMLAGLSLVIVSLPGQLYHEFHQLPLLPPLALYFGIAAAPLFDAARLTTSIRPRAPRALAAVGLATLWVLVAVLSFANSPVFIALYRPNHLNHALITAGHAMRDATPPGALLVTIEYDQFGTNSPMLLYYAERRGWSFDAHSIRTSAIEYLRARRGACFVATSHWSILEAREPETAGYLLQLPEVTLPHAQREYRLFDLRGCPRTW